MNWVEMLKEFEGIIGALGGVLITLVVTHYLRNFGTVKMHSKGLKYNSLHSGPDPSMVTENEMGDSFAGFSLGGDVLFENTSENHKAIHNIYLNFKTDGIINQCELKDSATIKKWGGGMSYDPLTHVNLQPKEIKFFNVRMTNNHSLLNFSRDRTEVFVSYEIADKVLCKKKVIKFKII